jgi:hypothetical protein
MMSLPLFIRYNDLEKGGTYLKRVSIPYEAEHGFLARSQSPNHRYGSHIAYYCRRVLLDWAELLEVL